MHNRIKILEKQLAEKDKEIQYYKRLLDDISNKNIRELEEASKVTALLKENELAQAELHKSKRMKSVGLMAGGVAHDLNNILSGIINYPELILLKLPEDSPFREQVSKIKESGQRAAAVVADLLTVARGVASTKELYDLNELVSQYMHSLQFDDLLSQHPGITCRKKRDNSQLPISCSAVHVTKCIMNLVTNAAEAIGGIGEITLTTGSKKIDCDTQRIVQGEYALLQVTDNGHGIHGDSLNRIFEPFYTKKVLGRSGTGLGLSVVWNTMEDHNGVVEVTSDETGSCFTLYFPLSDERIACDTLVADKNKYYGQGTLLVVDDEEMQREIASEILTVLGYHVAAVASGEEAIAYLRSHSIDLLLLDMLMGTGMNGYETYKAISKMYPSQKALIVSGFSESKDVREACRLGAGGFVKKPYTIRELGRAVKEILTEPAGGREKTLTGATTPSS